MSHSERLIAQIQNADLRRNVLEWREAPAPKIGFGYILATDLTTSYALMEAKQPDLVKDVDWKAYVQGVDKQFYGMHYPVTARIINLEEIAETQADAEKLQKEIRADLQKLGCRAVAYDHTITSSPESDERITQRCIALPCTYPTYENAFYPGTDELPDWWKYHQHMPKQQFHRDVEGAGILLAYLLRRQLVTEEEVENTYGKSFLQEAQKPENIDKVNTLLEARTPSVRADNISLNTRNIEAQPYNNKA